jgi:hypothetical protein
VFPLLYFVDVSVLRWSGHIAFIMEVKVLFERRKDFAQTLGEGFSMTSGLNSLQWDLQQAFKQPRVHVPLVFLSNGLLMAEFRIVNIACVHLDFEPIPLENPLWSALCAMQKEHSILNHEAVVPTTSPSPASPSPASPAPRISTFIGSPTTATTSASSLSSPVSRAPKISKISPVLSSSIKTGLSANKKVPQTRQGCRPASSRGFRDNNDEGSDPGDQASRSTTRSFRPTRTATKTNTKSAEPTRTTPKANSRSRPTITRFALHALVGNTVTYARLSESNLEAHDDLYSR